VTANGVTETLSIVTGAHEGFATDGAGVPTAATLADALAVALATHTQISGVVASYDYTLPGHPRTNYAITKLGHNAADSILWTDGATTATSTVFGFAAADQAIPSGGSVDADWNSDGYWSPGPVGSANYSDERWRRHVAYQARPDHKHASANYSTTDWGAVTTRDLVFDIVDDFYLRSYRRGQTSFVSRAAGDADDVNNLLEDLVDAAAAGVLFTIWTADNTSRDAKLVPPFDVQSLLTPASFGGARFVVTLRFDDLG